MSRPIFYDPSGRRRRWTRRWIFALLIALVALAVAFASTVVTIPTPNALPLSFERMTPLPFRAQVGRLSRSLSSIFRAAPKSHHTGPNAPPINVGFYATWADESPQALVQHIGQLDWVVPTSLSVDKNGILQVQEDKAFRRILANSIHHPLVVPMLQNVVGDNFSGSATVSLLRDPRRHKAFIAQLESYLDRTGDGGIVYDFESVPAQLIPAYLRLIKETNDDFDKHGRLVGVTVQLGSPDWNPHDFAKVADKVFLMAYDQHWPGGPPGPIAAQDWFTAQVSQAIAGIPANKVVVALGGYAYDWHAGTADGQADGLTVEEAWMRAHDSRSVPQYDRTTGNVGFSFLDQNVRHDVWMLDAASNWNEMRILSQLGVNSVALWRLGSEDPAFWRALASWRGGTTPDLSRLEQNINVDTENQGEILRITSTPTFGQRNLAFDPRSHTVSAEQYLSLPTPFVVQRTGYQPKMVALTFDDGPDNKYTPQILSILEQFHVPATFFVIGENGVSNRSLLERMVADGDEIGNHTYTHPNMSQETRLGADIQLNMTRRLVEAYTGHSIRLMRMPYFGDAEPTTGDELIPALIGQQMGYTVVGLHVDPGDWQTPGVPAIVDHTLQAVQAGTPDRSANIVLLHDGGGDRTQTVAALPAIISRLQAAGYQIVPVSTLAGLRHDQVMPALSGVDLAEVRADQYFFQTFGLIAGSIKWMFFFAIALGVIRSVTMSVLALMPGRAPPPMPTSDFKPKVTVIIPCFNEEKVIESSVKRILDSFYPYLDVIVVDDGSKDRTSEIVRNAYGDNPRVTLLTLENGGKAKALNIALQHARGEIIVALDADTQFERETVLRLVRWFVDPKIGAVAGNAKVGNRINLVTKWQAVEYVTAQNIERKALTRYDAIMVVPGAVGAWRQAALEDVGGYPENTLAEDQDLTIAIQRMGWKIAYDEDAVAWTEAPESFASLSKQRFRWSYGTLQCLWKHRAIVRKGRPGGLAFIGIPQAWLFQIIFACISPMIDLALVVSIYGTILRVYQHGWAQTQTDVLRMALYWACFSGIDVACGYIAYRADTREKRFPMFLLLAQRFVYRQLMYSVVIRAVSAAVRGVGTSWGKLERSGSVNALAAGDAARAAEEAGDD